MIKVQEIRLIDILPAPLKNDKTIVAIAKVLQKYIDENYEYIKRLNILPNIDNITDGELIDHLAYQFHVDFYSQELSLSKKKELVKRSIAQHRIKGTPSAIERALYTVFGQSKLKEWFEYGGDPYYFRIDINATEQGVTKESLYRLDELISAYKNTRSWLEVINIYLTSRSLFFVVSCLTSGEEITVYPYSPKDIKSSGKVYLATGNNAEVDTTTVYPKGVI